MNWYNINKSSQRMVNIQEVLQRNKQTPATPAFNIGESVIFTDPKTNQMLVGAYQGQHPQDSNLSLITVGDTVGRPRIIATSTLRIHNLSNLKPGDQVSLIKYPESENPATVIRVISPKQIEVITRSQRKMSPFAYSVLPL